MKGSITGTLAAAAVVFSVTTPAMANQMDAAILAETCAGCHGTDGSSMGMASPSLAGMDKEYFRLSMMDYASDTRAGTVMNRIAKGYTEADFVAMATYFSGRTFTPAKQPFDPALVARGQELHTQFCESCHEKGGSINDDGISRIAGQWQPYLAFSLADFNAGTRVAERRKKQRLDDLMKEAGDDGYRAVLDYYASQQ